MEVVMKKPDLAALLQLIQTKYGTLSEPNYALVHTDEPTHALLTQLAEDFTIVDVTDTNYDVSFRYFLNQTDRQWALELSMLGPYAVLLRLETQEPPVTPESAVDAAERRIIQCLDEAGITSLDRTILEVPIALALTNAEPGHVYLYHALIADTALLPWRTVLNNWWPLDDDNIRPFQELDPTDP
jgi:hypothetical protein